MIVIAAPSNLGLRPLRPGHEPGTWRAPEALFDFNLALADHVAAVCARGEFALVGLLGGLPFR
jgi:arginase